MKTKCKCGICGREYTGNSKWQTEHDMWGHIADAHKSEVAKFRAERKAIQDKITELQKSIPSLYSTEQQGKVEHGSWTI